MKNLVSRVFLLASIFAALYISLTVSSAYAFGIINDVSFKNDGDKTAIFIRLSFPVEDIADSIVTKNGIAEFDLLQQNRLSANQPKRHFGTHDVLPEQNYAGVKRVIYRYSEDGESPTLKLFFAEEKKLSIQRGSNIHDLVILVHNADKEFDPQESARLLDTLMLSETYSAAFTSLSAFAKDWQVKAVSPKSRDAGLVQAERLGGGSEIRFERKLNQELSIAIEGKRSWVDEELQGIVEDQRGYDFSVGLRWDF